MIRFKNVRGEAMDRAVETLLEERAQDPKATRLDASKRREAGKGAPR